MRGQIEEMDMSVHLRFPRSSTLFRWLAAAVLLPIASSSSSPAAGAATHRAEPTSRAVMELPAPPVQRYEARDGTSLVYRFFGPADAAEHPDVVAILVHGSGGSGLNLTVLGAALAQANVPAYVPDIRGQGLSGRRGDIDYIGQIDDDLGDFVAVVRQRYPQARLVLVGHSAGGGFALRIAGKDAAATFSKFVLLAPVLGRLAALNRPDAGWARPDIPRIVVLRLLNGFGITALNGTTAVTFNSPADTGDLLTRSWSYRMMSNFGPSGQTQLFGRPAYQLDAERARAPIEVIAGSADEQFFAENYAHAFASVTPPVSVQLAAGVSHMGVLSDSRAVPIIVSAVRN
jgi:alpha-beta hydrolase superfamily lysophospholipase